MSSNQIEALKAKMASLAPAVREAVLGPLLTSGQELVDTMKAAAPVRTGALRDSITMTEPGGTTPAGSTASARTAGPTQVIVTAGNETAYYARWTEFGTHKENAEPFFWPSYNLLKRRIKSRINVAMGAAVRTNWDK